MKSCGSPFLILPGIVILVSSGCNPGVQDESPRLVQKPAETEGSPTPSASPVADNSRCHVCHLNYEEEELAVVHAKANVGCETCHGKSDAHCGDEANITPPDIMYPKEKINPSCLSCHPTDKLSDVHKPVLAGTAEEKYCTDCHGSHRLAFRTQRWDKATGKPLP